MASAMCRRPLRRVVRNHQRLSSPLRLVMYVDGLKSPPLTEESLDTLPLVLIGRSDAKPRAAVGLLPMTPMYIESPLCSLERGGKDPSG